VTTRVYVPATLDRLRAWIAGGLVPAAPDRLVAESDDEEAEYAALMAAADDSAALLDGPGRRVVLVAEVAEPDADIPFRLVVAVHADPVDRHSGADPDDDLAWYATQELEHLLDPR
jgi:hypothetical protein